MASHKRSNGYGSLERSIMQLNAVINDICFDRALSEMELEGLECVSRAKHCFLQARAQEAEMVDTILRLLD